MTGGGWAVPEYDARQGRLTLKLVYYGPALSGKTTNLMRLHDAVAAPLRGEMMCLETRHDRTLFFDLFPLGMRAPSGLLLRVKLFTVPGQVQHDATRKAVLSRADGVVFVADSQRAQQLNNAASFENLADNAARVGLDFERLPLVVQFNKRDLRDIVSEEEVRARWAATGWPVRFASALQGTGVAETFAALLRRVHAALEPGLALAGRHGLDACMLVAGLVGEEAAADAGQGGA